MSWGSCPIPYSQMILLGLVLIAILQNIVQKMVSNQVVWHTTCRNFIDTHNVQRARKRGEPETDISPVKTRRLSGESSTSLYKPVVTNVCFFCAEMGNKQELRKASTLGLDMRVKDCSHLLGDTCLLRKLSFSHAMGFRAGPYSLCLEPAIPSP